MKGLLPQNIHLHCPIQLDGGSEKKQKKKEGIHNEKIRQVRCLICCISVCPERKRECKERYAAMGQERNRERVDGKRISGTKDNKSMTGGPQPRINEAGDAQKK